MTSIARRAPAPRAVLAAVTALALASLSQRAVAAPAGEAAPGAATSPAAPPDVPGGAAEETPPTADDPGAPPRVGEAEPEPSPEPDAEPDAEPDIATDPDPTRDPDDAAVIDTGTQGDRDPSTEPAAPDPVAPTEEEEDVEAEGASPEGDELPELSTLQKAGWWTLFGAFAVGTTAGVFAGLAERQEDRALRLATLFDSTTGAQPIYEEHRDDYEQYLRRGRAFERTAIGLGAVTGAVLVAGIVLFAVDAARRRSGDADRRRAHVRPGLGGWQVRF